MGKWDKILSTLPRFQGNDPTFQAKVEEAKRQIKTPPAPSSIMTAEALRVIENDFQRASDFAQDYLSQLTRGRNWASAYNDGYWAARTLEELLEKHGKMLATFKEAYCQLCIDQMENEGITTVTPDSGPGVRVQYEPFASVIASEVEVIDPKTRAVKLDPETGEPVKMSGKEQFRRWCIENGYENEMGLLWQTTNAIVKARLEAGEPEPPGIKVWNKAKLIKKGGES